MEQGRLFLAIALSFIVFLLWEVLFVDREALPPPEQKMQAGQVKKEEPYLPEQDKIITAPTSLFRGDEAKPLPKAKTITVNTPLYSARISEKGAVLNSFVLNDYRETVAANSPSLEIISPDLPDGTVRLGLAGNSLAGLPEAVFLTNLSSESVDIYNKPASISFFWISPQGVVVEKKFFFTPETYMIGLKVIIQNGSNLTIRDNLILSLMQIFPEGNYSYGFEGPSALINNRLEQIKIKKIKDKNVYNGKLKWIAVQNRYFMSTIIPQNPVDTSMQLLLKQDNMVEAQYMEPVIAIGPGGQHVFEYQLYFGPKRLKVLRGLGHELPRAVYFGWFDILAKPCLWIMNFLHDHFIHNYGVAIIILTVFTKILLWPLGNKSYKSMAEMKKIQPLMAEIREKHKNDRKKMNEEIMGLYKTYKINPLGGCLPMIVQIPVFFALYRMLYESIELRHAPFAGWITDLSAPDRLFNFGFSIPFMQPPYGIPVLTIIMGATMFVSQKMQPPMGDPAQAKMMMLMPIIFTVIFINFSSGLVLYWLVNNILSIIQQYYVQKQKA